jgi:hypothetical protein
MAKASKIKLSIPKPCVEDWDKMTLGEKGRHCSLCNNTIIDFSTFTDKELVAYLSKAKGEICGRVDNSQLNRLLVANELSNTPAFRRLLLGAALTAGIASTAHSQNIKQPKAYPHPVGYIADTNVPKMNKTIAADTSTVFKGTVIESQKGQSITYVDLFIQFDSTYSTSVYIDSDGKFSIPVPNKYLDKKNSLVFSAYGYLERKLTFYFSKTNNEMTIRMRKSKQDRTMIMGKMERQK